MSIIQTNTLYCDKCHKSAHLGEAGEVAVFMHLNGWRRLVEDGKWLDVCPKCRDKTEDTE